MKKTKLILRSSSTFEQMLCAKSKISVVAESAFLSRKGVSIVKFFIFLLKFFEKNEGKFHFLKFSVNCDLFGQFDPSFFQINTCQIRFVVELGILGKLGPREARQ